MTHLTSSELGRRIRMLRIEKGLTLKEIEAKVDISATHVSEVERGKTSPTIGALIKIAEALGVRPSYLIDYPAGKSVSHTRAGKRVVIHVPSTGMEGEILINGVADASISMFLVTVPPAMTDPAPGEARPGDKLFHILEGELEVRIGDAVQPMRAGDSIHFRSTRPHFLLNRSDRPCRLLWIDWPRFTL